MQRSFICKKDRRTFEFKDFALDLVLLQDQSDVFNSAAYRKSVREWVNWVKSHFDEFRVGFASFIDNNDHRECYTHKAKLSENYINVLESFENVQWKKTNATSSSSLAGSADAFLDESMGWNYGEKSRKGKYLIKLVVVLTDKTPILAGAFPDRPLWAGDRSSCQLTDGPDADTMARFMWSNDFHTLALVASDEETTKAWESVGHRSGNSGTFLTMMASEISISDIPHDEEVLKHTACEAMRNEAIPTVR